MWQNKDDTLYREFDFKDFKEAFSFMQQVAAVAEEQQHHPLWENEWNRVRIWLTTHDAGDVVTDKDESLADIIDDIYDSYSPKEHASPLPGIKEIKLFADGGSRGNPGPSASGFALLDMDDTVLYESGVYLGITTNNQAEYLALKYGLEEAEKMGVREVHVYMDSLLVVNQMKGIFKVKNRDLWPIHESIKEIVSHFKKVSFQHVPRELNKIADSQVNITLDAEAGK